MANRQILPGIFGKKKKLGHSVQKVGPRGISRTKAVMLTPMHASGTHHMEDQ